jgi:hypothetical protein
MSLKMIITVVSISIEGNRSPEHISGVTVVRKNAGLATGIEQHTTGTSYKE